MNRWGENVKECIVLKSREIYVGYMTVVCWYIVLFGEGGDRG